MSEKRYIGDAVYIERDVRGLILTTEDGVHITNRIVLESEQFWEAVAFALHTKPHRIIGLLKKIATAHTYDPGETDLDDEQPVSASLNLGEVRMARRIIDGHQ